LVASQYIFFPVISLFLGIARSYRLKKKFPQRVLKVYVRENGKKVCERKE